MREAAAGTSNRSGVPKEPEKKSIRGQKVYASA